jgi:hypothetical protein
MSVVVQSQIAERRSTRSEDSPTTLGQLQPTFRSVPVADASPGPLSKTNRKVSNLFPRRRDRRAGGRIALQGNQEIEPCSAKPPSPFLPSPSSPR